MAIVSKIDCESYYLALILEFAPRTRGLCSLEEKRKHELYFLASFWHHNSINNRDNFYRAKLLEIDCFVNIVLRFSN